MQPYTRGMPCPQCEHPLDNHLAIGAGDETGCLLCPLRDCDCVATWQWPAGKPLTINTPDDHDTNGPSTSA